jgi:hypothetical protein
MVPDDRLLASQVPDNCYNQHKNPSTITELFNNAIRHSVSARRRFRCTERREQKYSERKT